MKLSDVSFNANSSVASEHSPAEPESKPDRLTREPESDPMTEVIGEIGPWQISLWLVLSLAVSVHSWQMLSNKFLTYKVDHWCQRPDPSAESVASWRNRSAPILEDGSYDRCHVFDVDYNATGELARPNEDTPVVACKHWEYDETNFKNTAIQRWDLVCERNYISRLIQSAFFLGNLVGVFISGILADRLGRKLAYMTFVTLWITFGVIGSQTTNLYAWTAVRFLCGACSLAYHNIFSVYSVELTHSKWRTFTSHWCYKQGWMLGHVSLGGLAYLCHDMSRMELVIGLSAIPFLTLWVFMPESPRWLLAKGKKEQARKVLKQACLSNNRPLSAVDPYVDAYEYKDSQKGSYSDLFRYPGMRRNLMIMSLCWLAFAMGYYGLIYNTPSFDWNVYLVFALPALLGIPVHLAQPFLENKIGRKTTFTGALLTCSFLLVLTSMLPEGSGLIIICAWLGIVCCSSCFGVAYVFTKELFPTVLRTTALGTTSATARIGSILSPVIALLDSVNVILPLVVYGWILVAAGVLSLWLWPETKTIRLPESIEECEQLSLSENKWLACLRRRGKSTAKGEEVKKHNI